jgi:hypothetical protein
MRRKKARAATAKSAWLVTWAGTNPPEEQVVAILNHKLGDDRVRDMVQQLHIVLTNYSSEEKLRCANLSTNNPYQAELHRFERITCGHNPWLYAAEFPVWQRMKAV